MISHDPRSNFPPEELPLIEVVLNVGESVRIGNRVLRVLDTDGDDTMLRLDTMNPDDDSSEIWWTELPR